MSDAKAGRIFVSACSARAAKKRSVSVFVVREQKTPDLFAHGRAARLARHEHAFALLLQTLGESFDLRRLAGAVDAFKGDEEGTVCHLESLFLMRWFLFRMKRRTARLCSASVRENSLVPSPRATK